MLDDDNLLAQRDPRGMLDAAKLEWQNVGTTHGVEFVSTHDVTNIVWAGMGAAALSAEVIRQWLGLSVPLEVSRDYDIPSYVGPQTLFVAASYSGDSEEVVEALAKADAAGAQIVVMTAGSHLAAMTRENKYLLIEIPKESITQATVFHFVSAFAAAIKDLSISDVSTGELETIGLWLQSELQSWSKASQLTANPAKQLAMQLVGKTPIVYSGPKMSPAAQAWKLGCNLYAKNTAWTGQYPEFNYAEYDGWTSHPIEKPFAVVEIRSDLDHVRIKEQFKLAERSLSGRRPAPIVVKPRGETVLQQLAWSSAFGEFVMIYLAILNGVSPTN
jgi:glucose/mannose-6-phosphate isomerase